jgi:PAS domain S-box-containing protein
MRTLEDRLTPAGEARGELSDYLEGLMEGFVAYDENWIMTYMNASGERILRRHRADVIGKTWHQAFPHAVGNPVDAMYQRVMRTRSPERMEYFYPHYRIWMEISASPVKSGGVAVYFREISDRKEAEQRLLDADRRKDEFLATLAHELRNPLAPIRNGLYLLRMLDDDATAARQARAMMERQVEHLVRLVDDLLELSRITRGKVALRREPLDLGAVVLSAVETSRPAIEAARHRLDISLPADPLSLDADFVRLAQVVANLLNNAAKYTDPGGHLSLAVRAEGGAAVVSVSDNGVGIAPEMLPGIFDMFSQGTRTLDRAQGGLGIGLALSKNLVELHGGTLEARSEGAGRGAEFIVRLPLAGPHPGEERKPFVALL